MRKEKYIHKPPKWLQNLEARLKKGMGKRCKSFSIGCFVCQAWLAYDILDDIYGSKWIVEGQTAGKTKWSKNLNK